MPQAQTLSQLLRARNESIRPNLEETNLETGTIFMYTEGTTYSPYSTNAGGGFCWKAPTYGCAVIEAWGAGGSAGKVACCGYGLPGNSGAYAKKSICVWPPGGLTSATTYTHAGTGVSAAGTFNAVAIKSTSGRGTGAVINIVKTVGTTYSTTITATVTLRTDNGVTVGQDYKVGDTIVIDGANLGGVTVTNDLTITVATSVDSGSFVRGLPGRSCNNPSAACFRGCSDPTGVCWCIGTGSAGCMCAEGGQGGRSFCTTGAGGWCCYFFNGYCGTNREYSCIACTYQDGAGRSSAQTRKGCEDWYCNIYCQGALCYTCCNVGNPVGAPCNFAGASSCGIICNVNAANPWQARAYGGDINCCGLVGCMSFDNATPNCFCYYKYHAPIPAGLYSTDGNIITVNMTETDEQQSGVSGQTMFSYFSAIGGLSKSPRAGASDSYCYNNGRGCGCYEYSGCVQMMPIGAGAPAGAVCGDMCDHGMRGGMGAVRIKFF
jgi:hypothetical protein